MTTCACLAVVDLPKGKHRAVINITSAGVSQKHTKEACGAILLGTQTDRNPRFIKFVRFA